MADEVGVQLYGNRDPCQPGQYQVELSARLTYGLEAAEVAFEQMGYELMDLDQCGRSYRDPHSPRLRAEIDELKPSGDAVDLLLHYDGLEAAEVIPAATRLAQVYWRIYSFSSAEDAVDPYRANTSAQTDGSERRGILLSQ